LDGPFVFAPFKPPKTPSKPPARTAKTPGYGTSAENDLDFRRVLAARTNENTSFWRGWRHWEMGTDLIRFFPKN
jgi:hypothetical protein